MIFDTLVVGAGVVGLAVARTLSAAGQTCLIIDRGPTIGSETSSRNSEVIHAGLYYPEGSLKAFACVRGKQLLYEYASTHGVPCRRLGKLVVATGAEEAAALKRIQECAAAAGVEDLQWLDRAGALALEPALACESALLSPSTGIIDAHALMLSLLGEAEDHGAMLSVQTVFESACRVPDGFEVTVTQQEESTGLRVRNLINCAGLGAQDVAGAIEGLDAAHIPDRHALKGNYFTLSGGVPFKRLVYPVPDGLSLGVHLVLDMAGNPRFGPDTEEIDQGVLDYEVNPSRADRFYAAIRRYWPGLNDGALTPAYAGIRPKLASSERDFVISGPAEHGIQGLVNAFGIDSPGLTSSLCLAETVGRALEGNDSAMAVQGGNT